MRLLIVDDDLVMRRLLHASLSRVGHDVMVAEHGLAAWEVLQADPIRLVITDWMMPELAGPDLIKRIRAAASSAYTYIILLTAKGDKDEIVAGLETGADDYLTKPFHPGELRARVNIGERILNLEASLKESRDQLELLATHDTLTGLLNRRAIQQHAEAEWNRVARGGEPMSLVMLDIDHFKSVNDQHGHLVGDQALRAAADTLCQRKRAYDWVGRWGGEEFLLVLPRADLEAARGVAERIRARVATSPLPLPGGRLLDLRASLGVTSTSTGAPPSLDAFLQQADEALYAAKHAGRDRVGVFPLAQPSAV